MVAPGPVGVVVVDAVAGVTHLKDQRLESGNVSIDLLGRLLAAHHAAGPERLAVGDHAKLDASAAFGLVMAHYKWQMAHYKWQMVSIRQAFS